MNITVYFFYLSHLQSFHKYIYLYFLFKETNTNEVPGFFGVVGNSFPFKLKPFDSLNEKSYCTQPLITPTS